MSQIQGKNPSFILLGPKKVTYQNLPIPPLPTPTSVLLRISYIGICGSDVHFYDDGGIGSFTSTSPLVLGHELSGTVAALGPEVRSLKVGDAVAIEPGRPCRRCGACKRGKYNLCPEMVFAASPPYDGGAAKFFPAEEDFCYVLPEGVGLREGVLVEPLAVAVHFVKQGGVRPGMEVVVFGAGPVGLLTGVVAKVFGAWKVVSVDINRERLEFAKVYCATDVFVPPEGETDAGKLAEKLRQDCELGDGADVVLDASGAEASIRTGIHVLRPGGTYVQGGMGKSDVNFPIMEAAMKEVNLKGSFRYGPGDYDVAVQMLASGQVSVKELITSEVPFEQAEQGILRMKEGKGIKTLIQGCKD